MPDTDEEKTRSIIEAGSDVAGAVTSTATGLVLGGPAGALAGASLSPIFSRAIKRTCSEIFELLGWTQKKRVGALISYAAVFYQDQLTAGKEVRNSWFCQDGSEAESNELIEGCLLKARDTYQEKKLKHIAKLLGSLPFWDISPELANQSLILAEKLTYRQYCVLSLAFTFPRHLRDENYTGITLTSEQHFLLVEILDLHRNGLLTFFEQSAQTHYSFQYIAAIRPALMVPSPILGTVLVDLLDLKTIEDQDIAPIEQMLSAPRTAR